MFYLDIQVCFIFIHVLHVSTYRLICLITEFDISICVYIYVCVFIYVVMYSPVYMCACMCMCVCRHVRMYKRMYGHMYVCLYVCMPSCGYARYTRIVPNIANLC